MLVIRDTRPRRHGIAKDDAVKLCGNAVRRRSAVAGGGGSARIGEYLIELG